MPMMPQTPSMPATTVVPEEVSQDLWTMLKQDVDELPPHIQKKVKESSIKQDAKDGAKATRNLHAAATQLGHKRKAYEQAILARSQLHANWKRFLSDAVKLWQDYAVQFSAQEKKLTEQVKITKDDFIAAKEESARAHETAGAVQEISDEELGEIANSSSAQKITDSMAGLESSLAALQQQAQAIPEEELHIAKRQRRKHPQDMQQDMEIESADETGDPSKPFGKAG